MDIEALRAALKASEGEMEKVKDLEEKVATLEAEHMREFTRANHERAERIKVREELGMLKIEMNMLKQGPSETSDNMALPEIVAEHVWSDPGPLGVKLSRRPRDRKEKSGLKVEEVTQEDVPKVLVGLKLAEVNGENISESTYDEALAIVKAAGRPLTIKFVQPRF